MPPKKKGIWRESSDVVDGWKYTVYDYGLVKVFGGGSHRPWTFRLTSFVVNPDDSEAHKESVQAQRIANGLPFGPQGEWDTADGESACSASRCPASN